MKKEKENIRRSFSSEFNLDTSKEKEVLPEAGRGHAQHEPQAGAFKYRSGYAKNHHECGV